MRIRVIAVALICAGLFGVSDVTGGFSAGAEPVHHAAGMLPAAPSPLSQMVEVLFTEDAIVAALAQPALPEIERAWLLAEQRRNHTRLCGLADGYDGLVPGTLGGFVAATCG